MPSNERGKDLEKGNRDDSGVSMTWGCRGTKCENVVKVMRRPSQEKERGLWGELLWPAGRDLVWEKRGEKLEE